MISLGNPADRPALRRFGRFMTNRVQPARVRRHGIPIRKQGQLGEKQVMNTPRILITGATGKTETPAIKELRQQGIAVRAMATKKDERAAALTEPGEGQMGNVG